MNPQRYERWKDFALRMARTCFPRRRSPSTKQIVENVQSFFDILDPHDIWCIVSWDHSRKYPKRHPYYSRTRRTSCWHCHGFKRPDCPHSCENGEIFDYAEPQCVTDMCSNLAEGWNPYYWQHLNEAAWDRRDEQYCGPVRCCIRAGLDLASSPSIGVCGFTAGDLRRMYPKGVPDWVTGGQKHRWKKQVITGVVPGVGFVMGEPQLNGTFAQMTDEQEVWL